MKTVQKHFKNNEKNEKIMTRFGSRTSTLARGLRPVQVVFPLTRARALAEWLARGLRPKNGEAQRGDTTGRHNGKMMQNEKCHFYSL